MYRRQPVPQKIRPVGALCCASDSIVHRPRRGFELSTPASKPRLRDATNSVEAEEGRIFGWVGRREGIGKPPVVAAIRILIERVVVEVASARDREEMVVQIAEADCYTKMLVQRTPRVGYDAALRSVDSAHDGTAAMEIESWRWFG
jgi:hypothetical protein